MTDPAEKRARRHVRNAKIEMWGWIAFTPVYLAVPALRESVAVVGLLSIYALVVSVRSVVRA